MNPEPPVAFTIREAQPADYPAVARVLGVSFVAGKYRFALGADPNRRAALTEILLRHQALAPGKLYVAETANGAVAGTILLKVDNAPIAPEKRRAAQAAMTAQVGRFRAAWATWVLRLFSSPKVGPQTCYIDNLAVAPEFRGQGIALRLVRLLYDVSRSLGKTEIIADVVSSNRRVLDLIDLEQWTVVRRNFLLAPLTLPLFGFASILRIRKDLKPPS